MLDDYKDMPLMSMYEKYRAEEDVQLRDMRKQGIDPQSFQDVLEDLEYPADYKFICIIYHAVNNNAAFTRRLLGIYNTRLYRASDFLKIGHHIPQI